MPLAQGHFIKRTSAKNNLLKEKGILLKKYVAMSKKGSPHVYSTYCSMYQMIGNQRALSGFVCGSMNWQFPFPYQPIASLLPPSPSLSLFLLNNKVTESLRRDALSSFCVCVPISSWKAAAKERPYSIPLYSTVLLSLLYSSTTVQCTWYVYNGFGLLFRSSLSRSQSSSSYRASLSSSSSLPPSREAEEDLRQQNQATTKAKSATEPKGGRSFFSWLA